jgi:thiamine-triphosphatase
MGSQKIHDVYFDAHKPGGSGQMCILAQHGIWVRRRNNVWQAKQRIFDPPDDENRKSKTSTDAPAATAAAGRDESFFLRTVFKELDSPREIHALVTRYVPSTVSSSSFLSTAAAATAAAAQSNNFNLHPIADFTTFRQTFLADKRFQVVLDETCFGHRVGEVEILAEPGMERHAQKEIDRFMRRYCWFFLSSSSSSLSSSSSSSKEDGKSRESDDGEDGKVKGKLTAYFEKFQSGFDLNPDCSYSLL